MLQNILAWQILPSDAPPQASMIYGAIHLSRLIGEFMLNSYACCVLVFFSRRDRFFHRQVFLLLLFVNIKEKDVIYFYYVTAYVINSAIVHNAQTFLKLSVFISHFKRLFDCSRKFKKEPEPVH